MMETFLRRLAECQKAKRPLLFDGAMGTQLFARGLKEKVPEYYNLEKPEVIIAIHKDYVDSGSDVIQTNTFGANRLKLEHSGLLDKLAELNKTAVLLAREASSGKALVAGDIGPTGRLMEPSGELSPKLAQEVYEEQVCALMEGGVDLFSIETMFDLEELKCAVRAIKRLTELPIVASMTFRKTGRGFFTMMGISPKDAVKGLEEEGADVIGANCTIGIKEMVELISEMRLLTKKPLIAQANAGAVKLDGEKEGYEYTAETYAEYAPSLYRAGADIIGACCGSSPEFILKIKEKFNL